MEICRFPFWRLCHGNPSHGVEIELGLEFAHYREKVPTNSSDCFRRAFATPGLAWAWRGVARGEGLRAMG